MARKTWTDARGKVHQLTDQALVEDFLEGYVDHYSGGELEFSRQTKPSDAVSRLMGIDPAKEGADQTVMWTGSGVKK